MPTLATDLWGLTKGQPYIDAAKLPGAIEEQVRSGDLDYRTRMLIRDTVAALKDYWGESRVSQWLESSEFRAEIDAICAEEYDKVGFPSLGRRFVEPVEPKQIEDFLLDLGRFLRRPVRVAVGGSTVLILGRLLHRGTDDVDVVDEVPKEIRDEHKLRAEIEERHGLKIAHFQSHYLAMRWENRTRTIGPFGNLHVALLDPHDVFISKLFSIRSKDLSDLRVLFPLLVKETLEDRIREDCQSMLAAPDLRKRAEENWFILTPREPAVMTSATATAPVTADAVKKAREQLDAHTREIVQWHFHPDTGSPFWLEKAKSFKSNPLKDVKTLDDLKLFGLFEDDWLRGGPVRRWVPKALQNKPIYVFETGGTTGIPKSRVVVEDHWIDYELFSETLPEKYFPKGTNWMMLGPSGPRRLRLAVEHLAQHRGGICFCVDLDPRWVVKLIKKGWMEHLKAYQDHIIDQAMTILSANHDVKCMFTTPKLLDALATRLEKEGSSLAKAGITGIFCGGTEMTSQWIRFAIEEFLGSDVYIAPTYGNTLMGLAASDMPRREDGYKIAYYAPEPRATIEVVDFDDYNKVVPYGASGRVRLTTLTKELFIPGFMERDEGEREMPSPKYPWDGISGVKPWRGIAAQTTVGVY